MERIRVALYIRVSTEEQAKEGYSLEAQESVLSKYCNNNDYEIVKKYIDDGKSGKNTDRPELKKLMKDMYKNTFDMVLVWKISRLSRSQRDLLNIVYEFDKYNVSFSSYSEKFDTNEKTGRLMLQMLGSMAEFERETIVENANLGRVKRAELGFWSGGRVLGYDNSSKQIVVNKEEADIVKLIFDMYINGDSLMFILNKLHSLNLKTKKGNKFQVQALRDIITNPVYKGYVRYGRYSNCSDKTKKKLETNYTYVKGQHEPIISEEAFEKAQQIFNNNKFKKQRGKPSSHLLSGLLRCPICGGKMSYSYGKPSFHSGRLNNYYACNTYKNKRLCVSNCIRADLLESKVIEQVKSIFLDKSIIDDIAKEVNNTGLIDINTLKKNSISIENEIATLKVGQSNYIKDYGIGKLKVEHFNELINFTDERLSELETEKYNLNIEYEKACNSNVQVTDIFDKFKNFNNFFDAIDCNMKKMLINSLIDKIILNSDYTIKNIEYKFTVPNRNIATETNLLGNNRFAVICGTSHFS